MTDYDEQLKRLMDIVATPFDQDRSIVIYGLNKSEQLSDEELVYDLMTETLDLNVTIVNVDWTKPRGEDQTGVVKVELSTLEVKIEVLRAKRKCDDMDED